MGGTTRVSQPVDIHAHNSSKALPRVSGRLPRVWGFLGVLPQELTRNFGYSNCLRDCRHSPASTRNSTTGGTMQHTRIIDRIRGEYLEMPGLSLTSAQAQRLCGVDQSVCKVVLDALGEAQFLAVNAHGMYARA